MTDESKYIQSLREYVGYGAELTDAFHRFRPATEQQKDEYKRSFQSWFKLAPAVDAVCYCDITYHPSRIHDDAFTLILASSGASIQLYKSVVTNYLDSHYSLVLHPSFRSGLREKSRTSAVLYSPLASSASTPTHGSNGIVVDWDPTYEHWWPDESDVTLKEHTIGELWEKWCSSNQEYAHKLVSGRGCELGSIIAIPVGSVEPDAEGSFDLAASVFIGFDNKTSDIQVRRIVQYVLLQVYCTCGIPEMGRRMEEVGAVETLDAFSHEVRTLAGKVSSGWMVDWERWHDDNYTPPHDLDDLRVAPVPQLYKSVGTVLTLWSMSIEPDHLFPPDARKEVAYPPESISDVAKYAMYHAWQSLLIGRCEALNFRDATQLQKAWDRVRKVAWDRINFTNPNSVCRLNLSQFQKNSRFALDYECQTNAIRFAELSGVVRILVVLFENFLQNTHDEDMIAFNASKGLPDHPATLQISLKNPYRGLRSLESKASHVGGRSDEVMDFIRARYFKNHLVDIESVRNVEHGSWETLLRIHGLSWVEAST